MEELLATIVEALKTLAKIPLFIVGGVLLIWMIIILIGASLMLLVTPIAVIGGIVDVFSNNRRDPVVGLPGPALIGLGVIGFIVAYVVTYYLWKLLTDK